MIETTTAITVLLASVFTALGALGLLRMPDVLIRMHASTKIGTLACGLMLAATGQHFGSTDTTIRVIAIVLFLLLTAPIGAHMIARSVISTGVPLWQNDGIKEQKLDGALPLDSRAPDDFHQ